MLKKRVILRSDHGKFHMVKICYPKTFLNRVFQTIPNVFMLYGPNTNLGHNSSVYVIESQISHVMNCLKQMQLSNAREIEVKAGIYDAFTAKVQNSLARTVWTGCSSWYVDARGHNSTNWPGFTFTYRWLTRHIDMDVYSFKPAKTMSTVSSS